MEYYKLSGQRVVAVGSGPRLGPRLGPPPPVPPPGFVPPRPLPGPPPPGFVSPPPGFVPLRPLPGPHPPGFVTPRPLPGPPPPGFVPPRGPPGRVSPRPPPGSEPPEIDHRQERPKKSHYTISADQIAAGDDDKLYALRRRDDSPNSTASTSSGSTIPPDNPRPPKAGSGPHAASTPLEHQFSSNTFIPLRGGKDHLTRTDSASPPIPNYMAVNRASVPESSREYSLDEMASAPGRNEGAVEDYAGPQNLSSEQLSLFRDMKIRVEELEAENLKLRQVWNDRPLKILEHPGVQVFHQIVEQPPGEAIVPTRDPWSYHAPEREIDSSEMDTEHEAPQIFLSEPSWSIRGKNIHLKATDLVTDPKGYIDRRGGVNFAIYKAYHEAQQVAAATECMNSNKPLPEPEPMRQDVLVVSDQLKEALVSLFKHRILRDEYGDLDVNQKLGPPFTWWYHFRNSNAVNELQPGTMQVLGELISWIETTYGSLYESAISQFGHGKVSLQTIPFLYRVGQLVVLTDNDMPQAKLVTARLQSRPPGTLSTRSIGYRGKFFRFAATTPIQMKVESNDQETEISTLNLIPLEHVSNEIRQVLKRRGQMYWKCRETRFVSYDGRPAVKRKMGNRFMVDFATYKELHPTNPYTFHIGRKIEKEGNLLWDAEEPPSPEIYMFPPRIPAFDLRRKKWVEIEMDYIQDVTWNENAFKSLVADEDMKELILALVTNQLAAEVSTDVIENKGNGLIMLLHGSPGTGKTFTAESVAEIARKPLYSVTCGDIGTQPGQVEKYLESVFHLGKIWDCVVLLDEAEVFLEQRSLQDLGRNALVSVFLRALEYYDGILILTTNRVGSFDEAFKSRIQLALRYENLKRPERKQIWRNFMNRLKDLEEKEREKIDFADVENHIDDLADYEMNGRQIRNSITTARQLAQYRGQRLNFAYLKRTIKVADRFDKYLSQVREADVEEFEGNNSRGGGGEGKYTSDDYIARSEQMR